MLDARMLPNPASYSLLWNGRFLTFFISAMALWAAAYWGRDRATALIYYVAGHLVMLAGLTLEDLAWAARNSAPLSALAEAA